MIPRYSLYGTVDRWHGDIQEDIEGAWLKWKDTESYVHYALKHGFTPPVSVTSTIVIVETVSERALKYEQGELFPTDDLPIESDKDLVELMENTSELTKD